MTKDHLNDGTRTSNEIENIIEVDGNLAEIQRGVYTKPGFYGNVQSTGSHSSFMNAVNAASNYASFIGNFVQNTVDTREDVSDFRLTKKELTELQKKATSISNFSNIPYDVIEEFLLILVYIDKHHHMVTIADALQISELADPNIMRKPMLILNVPNLENIAFCASALEGLIHMFRKYISYGANPNNKSGESIGDVLDTLGSMIGGFGGAMGSFSQLVDTITSETAIGNFMSEMITGKRIPMTVIAKNPNLQAPSYMGKAFFGEFSTALSNVDIDQIFAKPIAVFPQPSSGSGVTSFGMQNMNSFAGGISVEGLVSKMMTGSTAFQEGTKKAKQVLGTVDKLNNILGVARGEVLDIRRADTALPIMSAMSSIVSGTEGKNIFSIDTFRNGWALSNSVSSYIKQTDKNFMEAVQRFL